MMDILREKIARVIWDAEPESKLESYDNLVCGPILADLLTTADAILAIPELKEAETLLRQLVAAIDAPRYGDDSIWDDLVGHGEDGGPLGRARNFLGVEAA